MVKVSDLTVIEDLTGDETVVIVAGAPGAEAAFRARIRAMVDAAVESIVAEAIADANFHQYDLGTIASPVWALDMAARWADGADPIGFRETFGMVRIRVNRADVGVPPHTFIDAKTETGSGFEFRTGGELLLNSGSGYGAGVRVIGDNLVFGMGADTISGNPRAADCVYISWAGGPAGSTNFWQFAGSNRTHFKHEGAHVNESGTGRYEWEVAALAGRTELDHVYYVGSSAIGATCDINDKGQTPIHANPLFSITSETTTGYLQQWRKYAVGVTTVLAHVDKFGRSRFQALDLTEQPVPGAPAVDNLRLYSYDTGNGITQLAQVDSAGAVIPIGPQSISPSQAGFYPDIGDPEMQIVALAAGDNYPYTLQVGRKAIYTGLQWSNGATADSYLARAKLGGADRTISGGTIAAAANTYGAVFIFAGTNGIPVMLKTVGDKAGLNVTNGATMSLASMFLIEFNASWPLTSSELGAFTGGGTFDTLLQVAAGYRSTLGIMLPNGSAISTQAFGYVNQSGATRTVTIRKVASNGDTIILFNGTVANGTCISRGLGGGLGPLGKIEMAVDSNAPGQFAQVIHLPRKI